MEKNTRGGGEEGREEGRKGELDVFEIAQPEEVVIK